MKMRQKQFVKRIVGAILGGGMMAGLVASANAGSVTVTDVTDWSTTPMEIVNADLPYLGYNGGVYAGVNTLMVSDGESSTIFSGFCIDPFHYSASGPSSPYYLVPLADVPKSPATLNSATAKNIEDLWAEYYSPAISPSSAAGLQIAIWELVSSNAVANDGLPAADAFSLDGGNDYGASQDLASLATYQGPAANLMGVTGPGQDYVIDPVPDGGGTLHLLALALSALALAQAAIIKNLGPMRQAQAIPVSRRQSRW
jgi:hypothetical protein